MTQEFLTELNRVIDIYENIIGHFAGRTRQMIDRQGPIMALSRLFRVQIFKLVFAHFETGASFNIRLKQ